MGIINTIKTHLANRKNYGASRNVKDIQYIVIHYTANDGDTDENNGKYFHNNVVGTSAHYFVDDDSVTNTVPDNYIAWHCGGKTYKHKKCRNANSIGIEICDDIKNGVIYPSAKTIENVIELTEYLMNKYSIPKENVIRHYDVTGKLCPAYWVDDFKWKSEFWNKLGVINESKPVVESKFKPYLVKITAYTLNVRKGVGVSYAIATTVKKGQVYTIVDEKNGWGKLKSGAGWINLKYTQKL